MLTSLLLLLASVAGAQEQDAAENPSPWGNSTPDAPAAEESDAGDAEAEKEANASDEDDSDGAEEAALDEAESEEAPADGSDAGDAEAEEQADASDEDDSDGTEEAPAEEAESEEAPAEESDEDASGEDDEGTADEPVDAAADTTELPPGVEPGSTRTIYTAKTGDTVESVAISQGFMPSDLRAWNDLDGPLSEGDELVLWVAPSVEAPPAEAADSVVASSTETKPAKDKPAKAKKDKTSAPTGDDAGLGLFAGVQVGPAFSLNPLKPAVTPRIEVGVELPIMQRSWRVFAGVQYFKPLTTGTISDDRVPGGSADYELKQDELSVNFGPAFRLGMLNGKVIPEVSVGPNIYMYRSTVNGSAGGAAFPETTEQYTRVGIYAAGGVGIALGPGELTGLLTLGSSALGGVVSGDVSSAALSPTVGYRFVF